MVELVTYTITMP